MYELDDGELDYIKKRVIENLYMYPANVITYSQFNSNSPARIIVAVVDKQFDFYIPSNPSDRWHEILNQVDNNCMRIKSELMETMQRYIVSVDPCSVPAPSDWIPFNYGISNSKRKRKKKLLTLL